jgi:hypothetical protein
VAREREIGTMSDLSRALKRWFGLPEINFRKVAGVGEVVEGMTVEAARQAVAKLDEPSFAALVQAVRERQAKNMV